MPPEVHFEAFQVSEQCVKLYEEGWFKDVAKEEEPNSMIQVVNPKDSTDKTPVIVGGKDVDEVDAEFFLVPVSIKDHEGPCMTEFPIENRLLPQGQPDLKKHLERYTAKPYHDRIKDFHLLLYLCQKTSFTSQEIDALVESVANGQPVQEGFKIMIDGVAGL